MKITVSLVVVWCFFTGTLLSSVAYFIYGIINAIRESKKIDEWILHCKDCSLYYLAYGFEDLQKDRTITVVVSSLSILIALSAICYTGYLMFFV